MLILLSVAQGVALCRLLRLNVYAIAMATAMAYSHTPKATFEYV